MAATQTYACFDVHIRAVLEQDALTPQDFERATEQVVSLILHGCSL